MKNLHLSTNAPLPAISTQALKTPFSPRLRVALATGIVALAAGLAPTARALAQVPDQAERHSQHYSQTHAQHHGQHHGQHAMAGGDHHMKGMRGGGLPMDGMGMGLGMGHGRHAERALDSVGATAAQKAQIRQIGEAARADLQAQREAGSGLREQARTLMTQPDIDAQAVEALRQQMLAQHDQASRRMSQAMVEMARVLTPDQRQALAERMAERRTEHTTEHMSKRHERMQHRHTERLSQPAR